MLHGADGFPSDVVRQQEAIAPRLPVYGRLLGAVAELADELMDPLKKAWSGRSFTVYYDRPLLVMAAMRADTLRTGPSHPLWQALAAPEPDPDAATKDAVATTLRPDNSAVWHDIANRFVQTNDVSRSVAWQWPLHLAGHDGPVVLVDLGASAGLNLLADRLARPWMRPDGMPLLPDPIAPAPSFRLGLDARPLDALDPADARWLEACVWPGENERIRRLRDALEAMRQAGGSVVLEACEVSGWPGRLERVRRRHPGSLILAYQTIVRDYLSARDRSRWSDAATQWLSTEPRCKAMWVRLEMVDPAAGLECTVQAGVAAGGWVEEFCLGRTGFHPALVRPDGDAVASFGARMSS